MRLWSIHPKYLDTKGLLAVWREGLLAQKVLAGGTKGYKNHPQLIRFRKSQNPIRLISCYLHIVYQEATLRGYSFDQSKIIHPFQDANIPVSEGQVIYEWKHLLSKLLTRDKARYTKFKQIPIPDVHPLFLVQEGTVEDWEKNI